MREECDGTAVLEAATMMTELERRFLAKAALRAQIEHARARPEQRSRRGR
jgi:hypothetical protein